MRIVFSALLIVALPLQARLDPKDVVVGIAAVFDGHNGAEASEMASTLLLDYFALHTYFLLDAAFSLINNNLTGRRLPNTDVLLLGDHDLRFKDSLPLNFDDSLHLDILKQALLRAISDIDEASGGKFNAGSTATIALTADDQLLVASIGDSKALLCSKKFETPEEARATLVNCTESKGAIKALPHQGSMI